MLVRYRVVGETDGGAIPWPITQDELADATGLSVLHVNRTLNQLREDGLIDFGRRELTVIEPEKLRVVAGFNANYLHLRRTEQRDGPVAKRTGDLV
jgi:DNA-binding transcriptional ArsR family regulator